MSGALVFRNIRQFLVPQIFAVAAELIYRELRTVAFDVAGGAHYAGAAAAERREGLHREGGGSAVLEYHLADEVVRLVVVAVIYAAAPQVVRVGNLGEYFGLVAGVLQVEDSQMLFALYVYVYCGIWTAALVRTAVGAAQRSALRGIFRPEPAQRAVGDYALARLAHEPAQYVEVVTALGEDDRGGLPGIAPVATHIGVGHVTALYRLHVLYAYHLAYHTLVHCLIHSPEVRAVAEHVADGHYAAVPARLGGDVGALLLALGHRLLEEHVISHFKRLHARLVMGVVRSGYDHRVCELRNTEDLAPVSETALLRDAELVAHCILAALAYVGHAYDLHALREHRGISGIGSAPVAGSYDHHGDGTALDSGPESLDRKVELGVSGKEVAFRHAHCPACRLYTFSSSDEGGPGTYQTKALQEIFSIHIYIISLSVSFHNRGSLPRAVICIRPRTSPESRPEGCCRRPL